MQHKSCQVSRYIFRVKKRSARVFKKLPITVSELMPNTEYIVTIEMDVSKSSLKDDKKTLIGKLPFKTLERGKCDN